MTGYEVIEAMNRVDKKGEENNWATVFIKNQDGSEEQIPHVEVKNGIVILPLKEQMIPSEHYELPKERIIFSRN